MLHWCKESQREHQWDKNGAEQEAHTCVINWFLIDVQRLFRGERTVYSMKGAGTTGYPRTKNTVNFDPYLILHTEMSFKQTEDLNIKLAS